jgi:O-antigen ligase
MRLHKLAGASAIGLVALAPIGSVYVRHWISAVFVLLVILMFFNARHWLRNLQGKAAMRLILFFSIAFFLSYLLSASLNGWDSGSTRMLERELRLLMLAPMAVFLAAVPSRQALGIGCLAALLITGALVGYENLVLNRGRDLGIYGPLFTGPACILFLVGSLGYTLALPSVRWRYTSVIVSFTIAAFVASITSRSAILGFAVVVIGVALSNASHRLFFLSVGGTCTLAIVGFHLLADGSTGLSFALGIRELQSYLAHEVSHAAGFNPIGATSVGARLEMMKASAFIFLDSPLFGIGPRNFIPAVTALKEAGIIHPEMPTYHPHNMFLEALVSKGLLGLSLLLGLLWACARALLQCTSSAQNLGFILLATAITMMFTESALLIKNNFASLFVLLLAAMLSDSLKFKDGQRSISGYATTP